MADHDAMITIERRLAAKHPDLMVVALTVTGVTVERTSADLEELTGCAGAPSEVEDILIE